MWKELINSCDEKAAVVFSQPASDDAIQALEADFEITLPDQLADYLRESNGDDTLMMSVERIFDCNTQLREQGAQDHMPLDCLLFFAENGCGGYYGYPVIDGALRGDKIYFWWKETDDRTMAASDLKDFLTKYYKGEI